MRAVLINWLGRDDATAVGKLYAATSALMKTVIMQQLLVHQQAHKRRSNK